jgi:signal transduction histidine kinase
MPDTSILARKSDKRYKVTISVAFLLYTLLLVGLSLWSYLENKKNILAHVDRQLFVGAACIKHILAHDFHDRTINKKDISPEEDRVNIQLLTEFAEQTGFKFLYTLVKRDNKIYITSSSATKEELANKTEVRYFTFFQEAAPKFAKAFETDVRTAFTHEDRWGTFRAAILPSNTPAGRKFLSVAEQDISYVEELLRLKLMETVTGAALLFLGAMPIFYIILKRERDVLREKSQIEGQLHQAHKMEALGVLAGGVAHDFNNLLQVMLGYSGLMLSDDKLPDQFREGLKEVEAAGKSGADLVRRLLTFSRKGEFRPQKIDLNRRIEQLHKMLSRLIPKMITIQTELDTRVAQINADPVQIEQIVLNLAVNARDAMPDGGVLSIQTHDIYLNENDCRSPAGMQPGRYALLTVSDTGRGITQEDLAQIFEPFYTTKGAGEGTGLGLAVVYGLVKQHGGHITCSSSVSQGTTFCVYFPAAGSDDSGDEEAAVDRSYTGTETILVADDEKPIRSLIAKILSDAGYTVIEASNGKETLELYREQPDRISLVVLDLVMPEMGGRQCLSELLTLNPQAKVLIASGHLSEETTTDLRAAGARGFLKKPFDMTALLREVRTILDED